MAFSLIQNLEKKCSCSIQTPSQVHFSTIFFFSQQNEGKNGVKKEVYLNDNVHDPLEKKGLEGLLRFINGTDEDSQCKTKANEVSAKAAKRARQKQKKVSFISLFKQLQQCLLPFGLCIW